MHTPGHSPGSVCFLLQPGGLLFSGDAVPLRGEMPIYDDPVEAMNSLEKLRRTPFDLMLSAWDAPRSHGQAMRLVDDAVDWIKQLDAAIKQAAAAANEDPMVICRQVIAKLGLSSSMVNPLVARTVAGHLRRR